MELNHLRARVAGRHREHRANDFIDEIRSPGPHLSGEILPEALPDFLCDL